MKTNRLKVNRVTALLLALTLSAAMFFSAVPPAFAAEDSDTITIRTAEELLDFAEQCKLDTWSQGKTVILQDNISLANVSFEGIPTFGGVFEGNGYTISGLQITQNTSPAGLFAILQETGVVRNLNVSGSVTPSGEGVYVGGVVGKNYGTVINCSFTGNVSGKNSVGAIAGMNALTGQILDCNTSGSVTGNKMTGGIAGCNLGTIDGCDNNAYINTVNADTNISPEDINLDFSLDLSTLSTVDTSLAASDSGGIAGYSSGIVTDCVNHVPVGYPHTGYNVGGIVGRSCGYIYNCENEGVIYGRKDVGGIAGQMEPYIAQNITESTLAKLESQLEELDTMLDAVINDTDSGVATLTSRLNRIADYTDSAADAASDIRTYGSVTTTVSGSGAASGEGSAAVDPSDIEVEGSSGTAGALGTVITPVGGGSVGSVDSEAGIQGSATEGTAGAESSFSADGSVNASTQIALTTSLSGLSAAISGMAGQMRLLSGEISNTSGTLSEDVRTIQEQINTISNTTMELFSGEGEGDILIDSSETDVDLITLGKVSACVNSGSINGDINVGGITGAMAMEYELDPEDDVSSSLDSELRTQYEIKAIVQECVNTGEITAKRSYAGGICGRMDLGLIFLAENYGNVTSENGNYVGGVAGLTSSTIRHCFAKCTLSGQKYIGGIVGSGVAEDLAGGSSIVAGCYSMVRIAEYQESMGAVSGTALGTFVENVFISDELAGINGRSYAGQAEPITYAELLNLAAQATETEQTEQSEQSTESTEASEGSTEASEGSTEEALQADEAENTEEEVTQSDAVQISAIAIPDAFLQFTLTFVADDVVLKEVAFDYGASFDEDVYPDIPQKEGYYAYWDQTELNDLHFDTTVSVVYTSYTTALADTGTRSGGRPIFFVEGNFGDGDSAQMTALPNTPDEFDMLPDGWLDFIRKGFSGMTVCWEIVEQWKIVIPDDGEETHTIRYLAPDEEPEHLAIYVKQNGSWEKADTEVIGSYLVFSVAGTETEVAIISTVDVWWLWLIAAALGVIVLVFICRLLRKIVGRKRRRQEENAENDSQDGTEPPSEELEEPAPQKKRRWLLPLLVILALLIGAGATAAYFILPDLLTVQQAYDILKPYADRSELSMKLSVNAQIGDQNIEFDARIDRTEVDGKSITAISQDDQTLYYYDGAVFVENGKAYQMNDAFPDYSTLLDLTLEIYRHVDIEADDGVYTITAENSDAAALLDVLLPSVSGLFLETDSINIEMVTAEDEASEIRFYGNGKLNDGETTSFDVSAVLTFEPDDQEPVQIPEPVAEAVTSGEYEATEVLSDDLSRIMNAWSALYQNETLRAKLTLRADCGPVVLEDEFSLYRWDENGTQIASIQKNGYELYFTDTTICNKEGSVILEEDAEFIEAARLLDTAYLIYRNADMDCTASGEGYIYTVDLDEAGMESIAYAVAPEAEELDVTLESGNIQVFVCEDEIQYITFNCSGTVQIMLLDTNVSIGAQIDFTETVPEAAVPTAVKNALKE